MKIEIYIIKISEILSKSLEHIFIENTKRELKYAFFEIFKKIINYQENIFS